MNPDNSHSHPGPHDPEARLTAFLLGELSPEETAQIERELADNPALDQLRTRLAGTIGLVREALQHPETSAAGAPPAPRLSQPRREALLAAMDAPRVGQAVTPTPAIVRWRWTRPLLAMAAGVIVLLAIGFSYWSGVHTKARGKAFASSRAEVRLPREPQTLAEGEALRAVDNGVTSGDQLSALRLADQPTTWDEAKDRERGLGLMFRSKANSGAIEAASRLAPETAAAASPAMGGRPLSREEQEPQEGASPRPTMDVRMMMRYGLLPKGYKLLPAQQTHGEEIPAGEQGSPGAPTESFGKAVQAGKPVEVPAGNVLHNWMALVTNRAEAPSTERLALGFGVQGVAGAAEAPDASLNTNRRFGGLAVAGGGGGAGFGGFGGGGPAGGSLNLAGDFKGRAAGQPATPPATTRGYAERSESVVAGPAGTTERLSDLASTRSRGVSPTAGVRRSLSESSGLQAGQPLKLAQDAEAPHATPATPAPTDLVDFGTPVAFALQVDKVNTAPEPLPPPARPVSTVRLPEVAAASVAPAVAAADVPVLGDRPQLGRFFRNEALTDHEGLASEARAAEDVLVLGRGGALAAGLEPREPRAEAELAPLPLQLPAPAFLGTPADLGRLAGGASLDARQEVAQVEVVAETKAALNAAEEVRTKPAAPPGGPDLYYFDSLGTAGQGQTALGRQDAAEGRKVEKFGNTLRGLLKVAGEFELGESLARDAKPAASTAAKGAVVEELAQKVAEIDDLSRVVPEAQTSESFRSALSKEKAVELEERFGDQNRNEPAREALVEQELVRKHALAPPVPQPEVATAENRFSTFSLNVSDVSFKLAAASLDSGNLPAPASIRVEEFVNAFDYRDPEPAAGAPVAFAWERAAYPFGHNRDVLRLSVQTGAEGREAGRPLNLVLLLDNSGSMERADRVNIIREALGVLGGQLHEPNDRVSVVAFARNARLWIDGLPGDQGGALAERVGNLTPEGGTNLEEGLKAAYETARRHYLPGGVNRVILLTDGAANLGDVAADSLKQLVEDQRRRGVALDCFGIGWEGYNDDLLEVLSRNGDGRYGFVNTPEDAASGFANQLAGALRVAAADVKAQVEFNPARVTHWRQVGYARHQLTQEQFRDNTVDAAEIGAAESGNALYLIEVDPRGEGPLGTMRVRYRDPDTGQYREHEWPLEYTGPAPSQGQASASMRLATTAAAFGEMLSASPFAGEVSADKLLALLGDTPQVFDPDPRPASLQNMLRQAQSLGGR